MTRPSAELAFSQRQQFRDLVQEPLWSPLSFDTNYEQYPRFDARGVWELQTVGEKTWSNLGNGNEYRAPNILKVPSGHTVLLHWQSDICPPVRGTEAGDYWASYQWPDTPPTVFDAGATMHCPIARVLSISNELKNRWQAYLIDSYHVRLSSVNNLIPKHLNVLTVGATLSRLQ